MRERSISGDAGVAVRIFRLALVAPGLDRRNDPSPSASTADMKAEYNELTNAGKPAKVALTAIMRKPIVLANALLKANRRWTLNPV
jgi:hypothetical protein